MTFRTAAAALLAWGQLAFTGPTTRADEVPLPRPSLEIAEQGAFSIPGRYVEVDGQTIMVGQMFVQYQVPKVRSRPYPVVMIHGGGQTGSNFLSTPDGRRGWADDFVANGYAVYVVDQSGRGRSGFFGDVYGTHAQAFGRERRAALHRTEGQAALAAGGAAHRSGRDRALAAIRASTPSTPARSRPSVTKA